MLKAENLNVYYKKIHAIKDISFEVNEGEVVSLIGANGAGKTTTLHTVSGLLRSTTGSITFCGQDITKIEPHKLISLGLAHVPEGRHVFLQMTVMENLEMGAYSRGKVPQEEYDRVFELFPRLKERKNQIAGTLSGGEQQMLAIGRAMMARPQVMLLDEPSMGLAPLVVQQIFDVVKDINKMGTTVLLVEQNARKALQIADYAYVMETGKIVMEGPAQEVAANPDVMAAYLGGKKKQ